MAEGTSSLLRSEIPMELSPVKPRCGERTSYHDLQAVAASVHATLLANRRPPSHTMSSDRPSDPGEGTGPAWPQSLHCVWMLRSASTRPIILRFMRLVGVMPGQCRTP